jgi:[citrate (pro-3S)-lyase] ligase
MQENGLIQELPLSVPFFRKQVETFLRESGLRMEELDHYYAFTSPDGSILAGAGIKADIIKCVAVAPSARSEGFMLPLLSRIVSEAAAKGILNLKVFTKPENQEIFESIGFKVLASAPKAILMENGRGLEKYCEYLYGICHASGSEKLFFGTVPEKPIFHCQRKPDARKCGVIVMNANPFTLGHKYLIEKALEQVDRLFVIPVKEDASAFPYSERLAMIRAHADARITVLEGSDYCISAATFPTYFLKDLSDAAETQMTLDIDLFERHIMPALGATVRFVGSEPLDPLTARYNALMHNAVVIPRLNAISASRVRAAIEAGDYASAAALCPVTTHPYLLAALAERALLLELNTPMKPGLVGPDGPGAHKDMDYDTMLRGIKALRPFWSRMAMASGPDELRELGIEAEKAMLSATCGVNTHRGAIFCLGIALNAAEAWRQQIDIQELMQKRLPEIAQTIFDNQLINNNIAPRRKGVKDARAMALDGYSDLFTDWLPFYREAEQDALQMTLLRIMSTLDDTCVIKRVGYDRAQDVKREAAALLASAQPSAEENYFSGRCPKNQFSPANASSSLADALKDMCIRYAQEGISPGGAADMLALTIFFDSII